MPVTVTAVPSGTKNRYAYDFPIRPGQTRFEVTYKMPYSGTHEFSLKPEGSLSELGVLLPKSMKFNGISGGFVQDVDEAELAVFFAKNVPANQEVKFSVSGQGLAPNDAAGASAWQASGDSGGTPIPSSSGATSGTLWFISGGIVILIGGTALVLWRKKRGAKAASSPKAARAASKARAQAQSQAAKPRQGDMLEVLKDELFQLETDRVNGKISQEEYEKSKAGLDTLFRRQMKNK
jgi:LPXTG-motif cell wall-anchored protein